MIRIINNLFLPGIALAFAGFALFHLLHAEEKAPRLAPPIAPPAAEGTIAAAGTGIVEAGTENIALGSAQSGVVLEVFYDSSKTGTRVTKGEPLLRVDDRALRAQAAVHRANLATAKAELTKLENMPRPEDVPPLEARVKSAAAKLAEIEDRYLRAEQIRRDAIAREEVAQRKFSYEAAKYEHLQAEKELAKLQAGAWEPDKELARAAVKTAEANVELVEIEIERCVVRAPVDCEILQVNVRTGEYVSAADGKALMTLGDLASLHVRAEFDEHDIPRFDRTLAARATIRGSGAAMNQGYRLKFVRVEPMVVPKRNLTGEGGERIDTRVLQAIYEISGSESRPFVGQQLDVFLEQRSQ